MTASNKQEEIVTPLRDTDDLPSSIDRRSFLMRHAVIGAAATMTGATWTAAARAQQAAKEAAAPKLGGGAVARPQRREGIEGPGDDPGRRVLQGRPRPLELAHDRADAHHLRLLPALHQAAGRPARQGDRPEGPPVRQPERDRQGPRHRARFAGRAARQGAGDGRSAVPRRDARQAQPVLPGEARRQDLHPDAGRRDLRLAQGRLSSSQHDDLQADGRRQADLRAGVLLGGRRLHRMEGLRRRRRRTRRSIRTPR